MCGEYNQEINTRANILWEYGICSFHFWRTENQYNLSSELRNSVKLRIYWYCSLLVGQTHGGRRQYERSRKIKDHIWATIARQDMVCPVTTKVFSRNTKRSLLLNLFAGKLEVASRYTDWAFVVWRIVRKWLLQCLSMEH